MQLTRRLLPVLMAVALAAHAANDRGETDLAQIRRLIGDAACSDDSECRVIGVGARACGGPEAYLAWSVRVTAGDVLAEVMARNAQWRRDELDRLGQQSTCAALPVPVARCVRTDNPQALGRCTLESAAAAR